MNSKGLLRALQRIAACAALLIACGGFGQASAPETPPFRLVMLGDSITAGYGLTRGEALPVKLEEALKAQGRHIEIVNAGVAGDTTAAGRARFDWALADGADGVLIALGGNDVLRAIAPSVARANLEAMLARASQLGVPAALAGMRAPDNLGPDYQAELEAAYRELSRAYGAPLYPFLLDGVAGDPSLNQADGIHPNAAGVAVIVARLAPFIVAAFLE